MSVVIETTLGDITVDLFLNHRPRACLNFLKLCKIKYYNYNLFHTISRGFIAQTGDPTGSREGGESIYGVIDGSLKRYFEAENEPRIKHTHPGLISFVGGEDNMIGSQFFITLGESLTYLDEKHCVFGEVVEGIDILEAVNEVICDTDDRPYQDVRITHTVVLDDPYPDPKGMQVPSRSPSPSAERLAGGRIAPDEDIDETTGKSAREIAEHQAEREAKARATILEMIGDIPDADVAPPENVLFVCKLNPVTTDDDLEIIFSRFGKINSCEVIRDRKSGESLQYAFIEFDEQKSCEDAYFKMDNVLIDDRRIHVDFSQSVSKVKWLGKGRGVTYYDDKGKKSKNDGRNDVGKGNYKVKHSNDQNNEYQENRIRNRSRSPNKERRQNRSPNDRNSRRRQSPRRRSRSPRGHQRYDNSHRRNEENRSYDGRYNRTDNRNVNRISDRHSKTYRNDKTDKRSYDSEDDSNNRRRNRDMYNRGHKENDRNSNKKSAIEKRHRSSSDSFSDNYTKSKKKDGKTNKESERSIQKHKNNKTSRKRQSSSSDTDSEDHTQKKKKKKKKKVESSSDSDDSSSEEDTSKKYSKKKSKKNKKVQKKKRQSSSSSSDSEDYKKKKHKKNKRRYSNSD